jgi:hypothetical protein
VKKENAKDNILPKLMRIYREYSRVRRVTPDSQMCEFWEDPTVEILVGSDELNALETEFGIEFDDDKAMELYDMTLAEAADCIKSMIEEQDESSYNSEQCIDEISPEKAKRILREIWRDSSKGRAHILAALEKIDYEDIARNIKGSKKRK